MATGCEVKPFGVRATSSQDKTIEDLCSAHPFGGRTTSSQDKANQE